MGIRVWEKGDRRCSGNREMGGIAGQGDTKGRFVFMIQICSNSNSNLLLLFSCPTASPDGAGARKLQLTLIYERRREAGEGGGRKRGRGSGTARGAKTQDVGSSKKGTIFRFKLFLLFYFSISQVSSACSPPPPGQTGKDFPLNVFARRPRHQILLGSQL